MFDMVARTTVGLDMRDKRGERREFRIEIV